MFSFNTSLFVLVLAAACNAITSATEETITLGEAGDFAILAKTGISTVPNSIITGNIGVSPITGGAMTGFSLARDWSGEFSTSSQIRGHAFAPNYFNPTPVLLSTAVSDMEDAYNDAASRDNSDDARRNIGGGLLGGVFGGAGNGLTPGVYTFDTSVTLQSDIFFSGSGTYIIQIAGSLMQMAHYNVILENGASASDIFWQVAGNVSVGAGAHMEGTLLVKTDVTFGTLSSLNGRVFAQTACNLLMATITESNPKIPDAN